ncbi:MAG: PilZ domain-containing protein, partial [Clostridia bacterium]|nr:PilZ domain-containing protein [Clostridia bacterium]
VDGGVVVVFDKGALLPEIVPGTKVKVRWTEKGRLFRGEVELRCKGGRFIPFVEVSFPLSFEPIERRRHRRVKAIVPLEYRKIEGGPFKASQTLDISGGGLRIKVDEDIKVEDELELLIYLPESEVISALARVVRIEEDNTHKIAGLEFMIIDERYRRNIVNFVFKTELKERQRMG